MVHLYTAHRYYFPAAEIYIQHTGIIFQLLSDNCDRPIMRQICPLLLCHYLPWERELLL